MASSVNDDTSSIVYRPVEKHEQQQALDLWYTVFKPGSGFFERYFTPEASPRYQVGDTLGAWQDDKLVSTVHIRRLTIRSRDDNREYLCGAIANVATLEDYRKRGYSRHLLQMAIDRMEKSGEFDMSVLGTGVPNHYSVLGWKQVSLPSPVTVEWNDFSPAINNIQWRPASDVLLSDGQLLLEIHTNNHRTYQFDRSPLTMFQHWTGWCWQKDEAIICVLPSEEQGYVVISKPDNVDDVYVSEWRASNLDIEKRLLKLAADEIRRRQPETKTIRFHVLPQYMNLDELKKWAGTINVGKYDHTMIRNIRLSKETFEKFQGAYTRGEATFWPGDKF